VELGCRNKIYAVLQLQLLIMFSGDDGRMESKSQFWKFADVPSGIINDRSTATALNNQPNRGF